MGRVDTLPTAQTAHGAASKAGWGAAILLCPHLALGTWLLVVPDHIAFITSQVVTLAHTAVALLSVPFVGVWIYRHARRMPGPRTLRVVNQTTVTRWALTAAVIVAAMTGFWAFWGGDISTPAKVHAISGILVGVPLAWHLWLGARGRAAVAVGFLLATAIGGAFVARRMLPPEPLDQPIPAFAYATRDTSLYESATWCGECHERDHDEWKRSTHARTLSLPNVRTNLAQSHTSTGFDLAIIGRVAAGERPTNSDKALFACEPCHAPTSFYGNDTQPMLTASGVSSEGVTCSFCHTIREVKSIEIDKTTALKTFGVPDPTRGVPFLPYFVSAPETVRRYLGQGSASRVSRWIANYLIRWRPNVHSHDYHAPIQEGSRACLACHGMGGLDAEPEVPHKTYVSWKESPFNTGDPKTTATCEDCHMVREKTGRPVRDEERMVSWGPRREPGRSHLLLGGNAKGALELRDPAYAALEHEFNLNVAAVSIDEITWSGDTANVKLTVRSDLVGHYLPAMETHERFLWVELHALDDTGKTVASTPRPNGELDFDGASPFIFRCTEEPKPECDTLIKPKSSRQFSTHFDVPKGARPTTLEAELFLSVDPDAIAKTRQSFPESAR